MNLFFRQFIIAYFFLSLSLPVPAFVLIAHRGVHHTYGDRISNGCRNYKFQRHTLVENTLPSVEKAFAHGADMVEVDLVVSQDGRVFLHHDTHLRCSLGVNLLAEKLQWKDIAKLDPGHGITFDSGKTYPLRGSNSKVPLLVELLKQFPNKPFLFNPKTYSPRLSAGIISDFSRLTKEQRSQFWFWGNRQSYLDVRSAFPEISHFIEVPDQTQNCLEDYFRMGWYGEYPDSCKNRHISIGLDRWWMIWDWPFPFLNKAAENQTKMSLWMANQTRAVQVYDSWPVASVIVSNIDQLKGKKH